MKNRAQIDRHHLIPQLERCIFYAPGFQNSGGVDQDVEPTHLLGCRRNARLGFPLIRQIGRDDVGSPANVSATRNVLERTLAPSDQDQVGALGEKALGSRTSNTARRAGDYDILAFHLLFLTQSQQVFLSLPAPVLSLVQLSDCERLTEPSASNRCSRRSRRA